MDIQSTVTKFAKYVLQQGGGRGTITSVACRLLANAINIKTEEDYKTFQTEILALLKRHIKPKSSV